MGDKLFFTAYDAINGLEVWVSDGTEAGTNLVKDINPGAGSSVVVADSNGSNRLTAMGDKLFFVANDGSNGQKVWVSDGTEAGTNLVRRNLGAGISLPDHLAAVGDKVFFTANDGSNGYELLVSDGPEAGTNLVQDINPGSGSSGPDDLTVVGKKLFFTANDGSNGYELWVTDINNSPVAISITDNIIAENQAIGTVVGTFSTDDADSDETYTYSLVAGQGDTDNNLFEIVDGKLQTTAVFDFETEDSYRIRVQTDDGNGGTFEQQFTIGVGDVSEVPEITSTAPTSATQDRVYKLLRS